MISITKEESNQKKISIRESKLEEVIVTSILSSLVTAVFAAFAFLFTQTYFKYYQEFRILRGKTATLLTLYAAYFSNPIDIAKIEKEELPSDYREASIELRKLASDWCGFMEVKPRILLTPSQKTCFLISKNLIGLSNSMACPYNSPCDSTILRNIQYADTIKETLKFYSE